VCFLKVPVTLSVVVDCRLSLGTSFEKDAGSAVLDLTGDDADEMRRARSRTVWSVVQLTMSLLSSYFLCIYKLISKAP